MSAQHGVIDPRAPKGTIVDGAVPQLIRDGRAMKDAFARCQSAAYDRQDDRHVENLARRMNAERLKIGQHIVALLHNAFRRKTPRWMLEAPFRAGLAMIDRWFRDRDGGEREQLDLTALIRRETVTQAHADVAETELCLAAVGDRKALADCADRIDAHLVALEDLSSALHLRLVS